MLTESLLLARVGGALGVAIAELGVRALDRASPPELPRVGAIGVNARRSCSRLRSASLIGLAVGLWPALHASRSDLQRRCNRARAARRRKTRRARLAGRRRGGARARVAGERWAVAPELDASVRGRSGIRAVALLTMQVQTSGERFDGC